MINIKFKKETIDINNNKKILVDNPSNAEALKVMQAATPARIAVGRSGARCKTVTLLNFWANHAAAQDAVDMEVSSQFIENMGLLFTQTCVQNKDEYLKKPYLGRKLNQESRKLLLEKCPKGKPIQIIVADGLSALAIEANAQDTLASLKQGLQIEELDCGDPIFVKYGRVGVEDDIATLLDCDVAIELVGERPGLATAKSMSAYMIFRPNEKTVEADRTVVSNIHDGGLPPVEAGAYLAALVKKIYDNKASGVRLSKILQG